MPDRPYTSVYPTRRLHESRAAREPRVGMAELRAAHAAADPRNARLPEPPPPTFEQSRARLRQTRVMPAALTVPCAEHHAAHGVPCWQVPRAVCGSRVTRGQTAQASAHGVVREPR